MGLVLQHQYSSHLNPALQLQAQMSAKLKMSGGADVRGKQMSGRGNEEWGGIATSTTGALTFDACFRSRSILFEPAAAAVACLFPRPMTDHAAHVDRPWEIPTNRDARLALSRVCVARRMTHKVRNILRRSIFNGRHMADMASLNVTWDDCSGAVR